MFVDLDLGIKISTTEKLVQTAILKFCNIYFHRFVSILRYSDKIIMVLSI